MAFHITFFSILMAVFIIITFQISSSHARTFEVGGKDGWTLNPSENYNNWSGRLRFLINDTLHFKYDGGSDSVLVVNKDDYEGCDLSSPIAKLDGGDSSFKLDRSGPFYFVSGNKSNCDRGQKVTVVVLALRKRSPPPAAATPPSSAATPPSTAATPPSPAVTPPSPTALPPAPAVSPAVPPSSSPSPAAVSPGSPAPAAMSPGSPAPAAMSPGSPAPAADGPGSSAPAGDGPGSPLPDAGAPGLPGVPPAGIPGLNPPGTAPSGGNSSSPGGATGPSPGSNNPAADVNSPPPPSPAAPPLCGGVTASLATMIFALWVIN